MPVKRLAFAAVMVLILLGGAPLSAQYTPMFSNFGGGSGVENDPFLITNLTEFNNLRTIPNVPLSETTVNRHFKLAADLDLSTEAAGEGWVPINVTHITLDGDGHTIRNLTINRQDANNQGLFGILTRVTIKNLNLVNAHVEVGSSPTATTDAGILAGTFTTGTVDNLNVEGTVRAASGAAADRLGGVFGLTAGSTLNNIKATVTVSGSAQNGGIAGQFQADVVVNFGQVTGSITGTGHYTGGIAGLASSSQILDTVSDVEITGLRFAGGLVGEGNALQIRRSVSYVRLSTTSGDAGGLIGRTNSGSSVIDNAFTVGSLSGSATRTGGIVGTIFGGGSLSISRTHARFEKTSGGGCLYGSGSPTMQYNYFDSELCTVFPNPAENNVNNGPRTPEQLRDNANYHFSYFDAGSPWLRQDGINDGVPYLTGVPLKATVSISPTAGWRMMGSPAAVSYAQLLSPVWTQGATGSNAPTFPEANVFELQADPGTGSLWSAVTDLNTTTTPGRGFIYFHFNDNNNDGTPNTTATELGMLFETPQDPIRITTTGTGNGEIDDWMLLANPYNATIRFRDLELRETAQVMYIYTNTGADVTAQDATNPQYIAWNEDLRDGSATNGLIAPFQGFLVWGESSEAYVEFATSAIVSDAAELRQRELPSRSLSLQIQGENRTNRTHFTFGLDGSLDADRKDALLLQPMASTWLSMFSMLGDQAMDIQHLPYHPADIIDLPIGIRHLHSGVEVGGAFTIALAEAHNIPDDWQILLIDNSTGDFVDLRDASHQVQHQPNTALAKSRTAANELVMAAHASDGLALTLRIIPSAAPTSVDDANELPTQVVLAQNYPNPFNPTTTLQFALPEAGEALLEVFAMTGQRVAVLAEGQRQAGWHTVQFDGSSLSSGVYVYRLQAGGQLHTRKFTLIK